MRIMGLDVGSKTVGVAISDPLGFTAQGLEIIQINEDQGQFGFDRIKELVDIYKVERFVVGLPKNMNNTSGPRVEASQAYGAKLEELFGLPVDYQDERLTTVAAERMLIEQADISRNKRKKVIDKLAAQLILQNYKEEFGKNYVLLVPVNAEEDENGEVEIQAYSFIENEDGTEGELQPIPEDSEDEWNMIEEVFNSFMEE